MESEPGRPRGLTGDGKSEKQALEVGSARMGGTLGESGRVQTQGDNEPGS